MTIYDIKIEKPNSEEITLDKYKDKVILVVNTATKCGLKNQFNELEEIYQKYKDKNFIILGFPSNQFQNQEPVTDNEMEEVCKLNFGVTFPLFKKIDVNGEGEHELYKYLKENSKSLFNKDIKWNFTKFLINKNGTKIKRYSPVTKPNKLIKDIKKYIND